MYVRNLEVRVREGRVRWRKDVARPGDERFVTANRGSTSAKVLRYNPSGSFGKRNSVRRAA